MADVKPRWGAIAAHTGTFAAAFLAAWIATPKDVAPKLDRVVEVGSSVAERNADLVDDHSKALDALQEAFVSHVLRQHGPPGGPAQVPPPQFPPPDSEESSPEAVDPAEPDAQYPLFPPFEDRKAERWSFPDTEEPKGE